MQFPRLRPVTVSSMIKVLLRYMRTTSAKLKPSHSETLKSWKEIPGPTTLPLIGSMHHYLPKGIFYKYNGLALSNKLYETYGPIVRLEGVIGREPVISIYDAESASQILRSENTTIIRPGFEILEHYRRNIRKDGNKSNITGLTTDYGDEWKQLRSAVNPIMLVPKNVKVYTADLDNIAKDMVARIHHHRDAHNRLKTKFNDEVSLWSLESSGMIGLGFRLGCLDLHLANDSLGKKMIECLNHQFELVKKLDFSPSLWKYYPTKNYKKAMVLFEQENDITKEIIKEAFKIYENNSNPSYDNSIFKKLLKVNEDYAYKMLSDMMFAGIQSVANTMAGILYLLAINPDKQKILRDEIQSNCDKKPYLKACLKEAMRLLPVSLGTRRLTTKEYNILGYKIPPNMYILINHQYMCLKEENYPRPFEYLPERWLVEKDNPLNYTHSNPFVYSPFGFGARSCVARRIAQLILELFTTRMIQEFQIEWSGPPPIFKEIVINYVKEPYNFIFKDAPN